MYRIVRYVRLILQIISYDEIYSLIILEVDVIAS